MSLRVVDLNDGVAMVLTDLHGHGDTYYAYRQRFLHLHEQGILDRLILCGDVIHSDGPDHGDRSLDIILDVIKLQEKYGPETIIMLLGNHELPHLYGLPLSRGTMDYTPRFEAALTAAGQGIRNRVLDFIESLPFYVRTAAGVMIAHCGASPLAAMPENYDRLANFDHRRLLQQVDDAIRQEGTQAMIARYEQMIGASYNEDVAYYLAVTTRDDPRYHHLLRVLLLNRDYPDFGLLWDMLFTRNERGMEAAVYENVVEQFLRVWSRGAPTEQVALVSGHIPVHSGHQVIGERQLRFQSWAHAHPHESGVYLRLDCASPVETAEDLVPYLASVFLP